MDFTGKVALITGGTRGIGLAVAEMLATSGCQLLLNYKKDGDNAQETASRLASTHGVRVETVKADMRSPDEIKAMFRGIREGWGRLDYLIPNAAFGTMGRIERMGLMSWDATYEINVRSVMLCAKEAAPLLRESRGAICAVSSIGSSVAFQEYAAVGSSKAALESLVRYLANELTPHGVAVNAVAAGPVDTRVINWFRNPEAVHRFARLHSPMGRIGTAEDIGKVVVFLLSDESRWIVGQTLIADGGVTLGVNFEDWLSKTGNDPSHPADE